MRENGYYWVKNIELTGYEVMKYCKLTKLFSDGCEFFKCSDLLKIDERRMLTPDEKESDKS